MSTALELFCDIIRSEMDLADDQIFIWDQKIIIPPDSRIYISVGVSSCKPFSNSSTYVATTSPVGLAELQSSNFLAHLSLDIFSRGTAARDRKEEVILALRSTYSQAQQELHGFYIAGLSNRFVNLSSLEGSAIPYRFNVDVNIQYFITKTKQVPYYGTFSDTLSTEA